MQLTSSCSAVVSSGFQTSKISTIRSSSDRFQASCSRVSSNKNASPSTHDRVSLPTLKPQSLGITSGRWPIKRVLIMPWCGGIVAPALSRENRMFGQRWPEKTSGRLFMTVVFNTEHPIEFMFHTKARAYIGLPGEGLMDSLRNVGYQVYLINESGSPEKWK